MERTMTPDKIKAAREEVKRFLARTKAAEDAFEYVPFTGRPGGFYAIRNTKATAALRRASMDLTHALADLRRGSQ
jgi:hypothetical protein